MIRVDPVLGFDLLGVIVGVFLVWSAPRLIGSYRRTGRALLGVGIAVHRGYWGVWRWCGEWGGDAAWLHDLLEQHQLTPWLATGAYIMGAALKVMAPWHDAGLMSERTTAMVFGGCALVWCLGSASPWLVAQLLG
ncbi:MAG: hypothetical protein KDK91_34140 [Gammaproteobacteria bacterium]|nr:hypothetical protein [Gammaproteobacteria bacterium]